MDERLRLVFGEVFSVSADDFTESLSPEDVPNWDSFGHIRLVTAIEVAFGVRFEDAEVMEMVDVPAIREILQRRVLAA
jgi:acyl carrier protein